MNTRAMRISEAAALYELTPSALRWWEKQGVVAAPARTGNQRLYQDLDLRRIGMAYLCCVNGGMTLDRAAVVTSGKADRQTWHRAITDQIGDIDRQLDRMKAARDYLVDLLTCEDDDPVRCPWLDVALERNTPLGRRGRQACASCAQPITPPARGRPRKYCSRACQQRAYRQRRARA